MSQLQKRSGPYVLWLCSSWTPGHFSCGWHPHCKLPSSNRLFLSMLQKKHSPHTVLSPWDLVSSYQTYTQKSFYAFIIDFSSHRMYAEGIALCLPQGLTFSVSWINNPQSHPSCLLRSHIYNKQVHLLDISLSPRSVKQWKVGIRKDCVSLWTQERNSNYGTGTPGQTVGSGLSLALTLSTSWAKIVRGKKICFLLLSSR